MSPQKEAVHYQVPASPCNPSPCPPVSFSISVDLHLLDFTYVESQCETFVPGCSHQARCSQSPCLAVSVLIPPVDGHCPMWTGCISSAHLGWFPLLAVVNTAAVSIGVHCVSVLWGVCLMVKLLGPSVTVSSLQVSRETLQVAAPSFIPTSRVWFSTFSPALSRCPFSQGFFSFPWTPLFSSPHPALSMSVPGPGWLPFPGHTCFLGLTYVPFLCIMRRAAAGESEAVRSSRPVQKSSSSEGIWASSVFAVCGLVQSVGLLEASPLLQAPAAPGPGPLAWPGWRCLSVFILGIAALP